MSNQAESVALDPGPTSRIALRDLVTPERLRDFFAPRSIAMVGASENSGWARNIVTSCTVAGFTGQLMPVHPTVKTVFGLPAVPSLRDLPSAPDLAYILAPVRAVEGIIDDMAATGIRNAVVLASGYRETGAEGRAREHALIARAAAHRITLQGPNCIGFANVAGRGAAYALPLPPVKPGPVAITLQSGGMTNFMLSFCQAHGIGISTIASMGNESMLTSIDVLRYLVEDESTRVICQFLEEIADPEGFALAAARADELGKPVVVLKAGSSPAGQQAALAHTGSVAGDDKVVEAALRQLNIIRVAGIEELLTTAALLAYNRWPRGRRVGVLSGSGGACDLIVDQASAEGAEIPDFAPETVAAISRHLPATQAVRNPLDVGANDLANMRSKSGFMSAVDYALEAATRDPNLDLILFSGINLPPARPADLAVEALVEERMSWLASQIASSPIPVISIGYTCLNLTDYGRDLLHRHGMSQLPGISEAVQALGNALRWLDGRGEVRAIERPAAAAGVVAVHGPWSEAQARELLASAGVPLVPAELARSADEAAEAARRVGLPVALKICSAQITHKSDIGGVALGLSSEAEVIAAYEKIRGAGDAVPGAVVDGVLVSPMRAGGVELLAGVSVDPTFGPVLAVGLGGIWVEVLQDASLRVLPAGAAEVKKMLGELRAAPLLRGARGTVPLDLDAAAEAISRIGEAAVSLGGTLRALEVNPLWVSGDRVEALDALVVTARGGDQETE